MSIKHYVDVLISMVVQLIRSAFSRLELQTYSIVINNLSVPLLVSSVLFCPYILYRMNVILLCLHISCIAMDHSCNFSFVFSLLLFI